MAFIGVRMSWDILERKSVLARLAFSAARYASFSALWDSISAFFSCDTSIDASRTLTSFVPSHSSGMKDAILYVFSSSEQYSNL